MTVNAEYEMSKIFSQEVLQSWESESSMKNFNMLEISKGGNKYAKRYAESIGELEMMEVLAPQLAEFHIEQGMIQLPVFPVRVKITVEEYDMYLANGAMPANLGVAGRDLARAIEKRMWQGPPATGPGSEMLTKFYGINDVGTGTGTYSRPLTCDGGSTAEDWEDSGMVDQDKGAMMAALESKGFDPPYGFFYPKAAAALFRYPYKPSSTSVDGTILQHIQSDPDIAFTFGVGDDASGYCLMTGAAETAQAAQVFMLSMPNWIIVYNEALNWKLHYSDDDLCWYLDGAFRGCIFPIAKKNPNGSVYKGMSEIDSIDLSD